MIISKKNSISERKVNVKASVASTKCEVVKKSTKKSMLSSSDARLLAKQASQADERSPHDKTSLKTRCHKAASQTSATERVVESNEARNDDFRRCTSIVKKTKNSRYFFRRSFTALIANQSRWQTRDETSNKGQAQARTSSSREY